MKIEDKHKLIDIIELYTDMLFDRYYITNPPLLKKMDRVGMGYGSNKSKESQSINFVFNTTKPSEEEIKSSIKVFVDMLEMNWWLISQIICMG